MQALDSRTVNPARAALVHACRFRLGDALQLALAPEVRLELCEQLQHVKKCLIPSLNDRNLPGRRGPGGSKVEDAGFARDGFSSSGLGITRRRAGVDGLVVAL